jgi:hypothetical protein
MNFKENLLVLPSAGYVRIDDVKRSLLRLSDISTSTVDYSFGDGGTTTASNVASYFDGDKIWVAFDNAKEKFACAFVGNAQPTRMHTIRTLKRARVY